MPLQPVGEMMQAARRGRYAVGYFESWNLESLQGVIDAAEETRSPMIIGFNGEFLSSPERIAAERISLYAAMGRAAAESSSAPLGLVFNECSRDEWIRQAVKAGFGQVMLDDSQAAPDEFVRRAADLARYAHEHGVLMEAEVGHLPRGTTGEVDEGGGRPTDPDAAAEFVRQTGVDMISVSVGNVHALVRGRRSLDMDLLDRISRRLDVYLDLHGGTGIDEESLKKAISIGVTKVCYGTYLKQGYLAGVRKALAGKEINPHRLLSMGGPEDVMVAGRFAVRDAVLERIELLGCCGRA